MSARSLLISFFFVFSLVSFSHGELLRCLNGQEVYVDSVVGTASTFDVLLRNLSPNPNSIQLVVTGAGFELVSSATTELPARVSTSKTLRCVLKLIIQ